MWSDKFPFTSFHLFPRNWQEWRRAALFPFQAYVVIAIFVERHYWSSLPGYGGYRGSLGDFKAEVILGYAVCAAVLLSVGLAQILTGYRRRAWWNLGLAGTGALIALSMMNFVVA